MFCHHDLHVRASGRSRKKKSNFAGFLGANSRKKTANFAGISLAFSRPVSLKNDWQRAANFVGASRANFAAKRLVLR